MCPYLTYARQSAVEEKVELIKLIFNKLKQTLILFGINSNKFGTLILDFQLPWKWFKLNYAHSALDFLFQFFKICSHSARVRQLCNTIYQNQIYITTHSVILEKII